MCACDSREFDQISYWKRMDITMGTLLKLKRPINIFSKSTKEMNI